MFLMWVGMFFVWDNPVSWVVALVVMAATYFVEAERAAYDKQARTFERALTKNEANQN